MRFEPGDRVMRRTVDDDGLPRTRYGTVGGVLTPGGPVVVMFDDVLGGDILEPSEVELVLITTIELQLDGVDLAADPDLRQGLASMWLAELERSGLAIESHFLLGAGLRDSSDTWALAEVNAHGATYIVRVHTDPNNPGIVRVRADQPNRWEW